MCALVPLHVCVDPVVYEREHNSKTNKNHDGGYTCQDSGFASEMMTIHGGRKEMGWGKGE